MLLYSASVNLCLMASTESRVAWVLIVAVTSVSEHLEARKCDTFSDRPIVPYQKASMEYVKGITHIDTN